MYSVDLENSLISPDIVNLLSERCSVQLDIDQTKIKSAAIVAQDIDLKTVLTDEQIESVRNPQSSTDEILADLVIPAWCWYTYYRCLSLNVGSFTDSGFVVENEAEGSEEILSETQKDVANIALVYLRRVVDYLEERGDEDIESSDIPLRVRTMGGQENRASN